VGGWIELGQGHPNPGEGRPARRRGPKSADVPRGRRRYRPAGDRARGRAVLLVGHSYGGAVYAEAGADPKVAGLVYVAAFAPDARQGVLDLGKDLPPAAAS